MGCRPLPRGHPAARAGLPNLARAPNPAPTPSGLRCGSPDLSRSPPSGSRNTVPLAPPLTCGFARTADLASLRPAVLAAHRPSLIRRTAPPRHRITVNPPIRNRRTADLEDRHARTGARRCHRSPHPRQRLASTAGCHPGSEEVFDDLGARCPADSDSGVSAGCRACGESAVVGIPAGRPPATSSGCGSQCGTMADQRPHLFDIMDCGQLPHLLRRGPGRGQVTIAEPFSQFDAAFPEPGRLRRFLHPVTDVTGFLATTPTGTTATGFAATYAPGNTDH
jgi:hypothetical protein